MPRLSPGNSWRCCRGTLAAAGSDGVYRRTRLEEMLYKVRGQMQYLDRWEVFTVDCGEKEMVKPWGGDQTSCSYQGGGAGEVKLVGYGVGGMI